MVRVSEVFQIKCVDIIISTLLWHRLDLVNLLLPNSKWWIQVNFLLRFGLGSLVYIRVQQFAIIIDFST